MTVVPDTSLVEPRENLELAWLDRGNDAAVCGTAQYPGTVYKVSEDNLAMQQEANVSSEIRDLHLPTTPPFVVRFHMGKWSQTL